MISRARGGMVAGMTDSPPTPDTAAIYLAKRMIGERGYEPGVVAEAKPLADAADLALTRADGMSFVVVLILDREAHPERRFALPLAQVVELGHACLGYTGKMHGTKIPVSVQIWEVGPGASEEPEVARLKAFARNWPGEEKVVVSAWTLDTTSGRVTSTARWGGALAGRGWLARALREPRKPDHELARPAPAAVSEAGTPWLTITMLAALALVFAAEHVFAVAPWSGALAPDILTLVAMGGLMPALVDGGEWWRMLTAAVLHGDAFHLLLNGVALMLGAVVLEGLFGRSWLLALFMLGALGGSLLSYALNPAEMVSVGASGAIMGLLAAAFTSSYRLPDGAQRAQIQVQMMQVLIPSMIPLAMRGGKVDYAAHLGGAIVGALVGWILLRTWPRSEPLPRFRPLARVVAVAGLLVLAFGFTRVAAGYGEYGEAAAARSFLSSLVPDEELPASEAAMLERSADLAARFPRDPRARFANALRLAQAGDLAAAEQELRRGLDEREILAAVFPDRQLEITMRAVLAELLQAQDQPDAAREAAAPVCAAGPDGAVPELLIPLGVCR